MISRFKRRFSRGDEGVRVKSRKISSTGERLQRYAEAVTFAEAGVQDMAQAIIRQEIQQRPKVLVVGDEEHFSHPLVEYAVGFAKRMGYEIVALNCVPFGHEAPKVLNDYQEELCKEFECRAAKGVQLLACRAAEENVSFHHIVKFGPPDDCIREVHDEIRRVEFVLTEPEVAPEEGMEPAIPVFCLAR